MKPLLAILCLLLGGCAEMPKLRFHIGGFETAQPPAFCGTELPPEYTVAMFVAQYFVARREWPLSAAQIVAHQTELGAKGAAQLLERLGTIEFAIDSENLVMSFQPPGSHVGGRLTLSPRTTPAEIYSSIRLESTVPPQKP